MNFVVDRIENGIIVAVTELGEKFNLPASLLENANEGDCFEIRTISSDNKKNELENRLNNLFKRGIKDDE